MVFGNETLAHISVAVEAPASDTHHGSTADTDAEFMTESPVSDAALRAGFSHSILAYPELGRPPLFRLHT